MSKNNGSTIIELMVIIVILGVLIAIAAPSFTESMARRRLEGATNELRADLHHIKSLAVSINSTISLETSAHGYTVSRASNTLKSTTLDPKITITSPLTLSFEPYRDFATTNASLILTHSQTSAQLNIKVDTMGGIQICSPSSSFGGYMPC